MNDGFINEELLRNEINSKSYINYNSNIRAFLNFLFDDNLNPNMKFIAGKKAGKMKPDLYISHNGIEKYISVKKGSGNSVHQESIDVFFPFFQELLGSELLTDLKMFHYGDDTTDDSGLVRYSASECKSRYSGQISRLNKQINDIENIDRFLDRFLFVGNVKSATVDAIYHGTIDKGLWASRNEIMDYVHNHVFSLNAVHFGPLTYQVWGRDEKRTAVHPDRRYVMQVKWGSIAKDLENIRKGL